MTPLLKNQANELLAKCTTFCQADDVLQKLRPKQTMAMRWGLWDGYMGRPPSLAGLTKEKEPTPEIKQDYQEGWAIGSELSQRSLPA